MSTETRIQTFQLTKRFRSTCALDRITWELPPGVATGLVGHNASGKSTLLKCVVGLLVPSDGTCRTLGAPAAELDEDQLKRIGFVDQETRLLDWLNVGQHIAYFAALQPRWDRDLALRLREELGLEENKRVRVLSQGMRQRLALLLAVCHHPELLVLDEPVSALDPVVRQEALALILERVIDDGTSVVISSHVLHDIEKIVDRVLCLEAGRVVADTSLDELKESYSEWIVTSSQCDLPRVFSESYVLAREGNGRRVRLSVRASAADLAAFRDRHGVEVECRRLDLERIYPLLKRERS